MAYSHIRNILFWKSRQKPVAIPVSEMGGSSKAVLKQLVNKELNLDQMNARALKDSRKNPFAQELYDEMTNSGPNVQAMLSRDMTKGNLGSPEIESSPLGYVFKANADACPRCLMFDGTWVANPMDAQLLSHPGCRCSIVPRQNYESYKKTFGISTEEAAQNNKDYGHSTELTPWMNLLDDEEDELGKNNSYFRLTQSQKAAKYKSNPWTAKSDV